MYSKNVMHIVSILELLILLNYDCVFNVPFGMRWKDLCKYYSVILCMSLRRVRLQHISNYLYKCDISMITEEVITILNISNS